MKAAVLNHVNDISCMTVADPQMQQGDMLIKVKAATICGTDLRILRGKKTAGIRYPSILGHEFSGVVVDTGGNSQFAVGDRVGICPQFSCGECAYCKRDAENLCSNMIAMGYQIDGAFAECVRIPAQGVRTGNVFALPDGMSFEAAALAEPLACVMNGQERVGVGSGDTVVILGAGPIGLMHIKLARLAGARKIIVSQTSETRRQAALAAGADIAVDPNQENLNAIVRDATGGLGADVVIVAIGVPALANEAISLARGRGRVSLFAGFDKGTVAPLDVNAIHYNEVMVTGAFGLSRRLFAEALDRIASGRLELDTLITHRFKLEEIESAIQAAENRSALKVAIV
jgi:L-iditol 2-dehydrogenase